MKPRDPGHTSVPPRASFYPGWQQPSCKVVPLARELPWMNDILPLAVAAWGVPHYRACSTTKELAVCNASSSAHCAVLHGTVPTGLPHAIRQLYHKTLTVRFGCRHLHSTQQVSAPGATGTGLLLVEPLLQRLHTRYMEPASRSYQSRAVSGVSGARSEPSNKIWWKRMITLVQFPSAPFPDKPYTVELLI